jgi:TAG lipase/lysophosphatidylethanolamine acyltransferase
MIVELRHRLRQLDYLGVLPAPLSRLLIDETIPGPNLTLVPDLCFWDLRKLFQSPTKDRVSEWTLKGERGVWPAISALKVREAVEIELVRRRRPSDASLSVSVPKQVNAMNEGLPRRRRGGSENEEGILADRE